MDIHPSQIPISQLFDVKDHSEAWKVINEMLAMDFSKETGCKILIPKDQKIARKLGFTIVNELNKGLRIQRYKQNIRYFVYHHDPEHYAIVIASEETLAKLRL
jgi:hypothetical protein